MIIWWITAFLSSFCSVPLPPTNARVASSTKTQLTFKWTAPENIQTAKYSVKLESKFWKHNLSFEVDNVTNYTFRNLTSGTKYNFEVKTVTDDQTSEAAMTSCNTGEVLRPGDLKRSWDKFFWCSQGNPNTWGLRVSCSKPLLPQAV